MKFILLILTLLFVGCDNPLEPEITFLNIYLDSEKDSNGYYHLDYNYNHIQTFAKLEAYVGVNYVHLTWESDTKYCVQMWNFTECNDVVNPASYSGNDGIANQMMGVHQEHIGDTITVHCSYHDDYGVEYLNNVKVIINE